jgi:hypothetical protein
MNRCDFIPCDVELKAIESSDTGIARSTRATVAVAPVSWPMPFDAQADKRMIRPT